MRILWAAVAALFLAFPAKAEWNQASSAHFVIYSEQRPEVLRAFATKLEKFDGAVRALRQMRDLPLSQGNRVTIFVVRDDKEVRRLAGEGGSFLRGFYYPSAAGSIAFVPRRQDGGDLADDITIVLHEYSHHLMMQDLSKPYPEWWSRDSRNSCRPLSSSATGRSGSAYRRRTALMGCSTAARSRSRPCCPADTTRSPPNNANRSTDAAG